MPPIEESSDVDSALRAAYLLIGDEKLQRELQDEARSRSALDRLGLPPAARAPLLEIVNKLASRGVPAPAPGAQPTPARQAPSEVERVLLESFVHIRWSFWTSIIMSVVLFLVGLAFVGVALAQSLSASEFSRSALTLAGLGMADFVLLFYTRPWKDVASNVANSQQIRMIATSYLAGYALIRSGSPEQRKALEDLTERSLRLVQEFVGNGRTSAGADPTTTKTPNT